jgi:hypothetical protein
MSKRYPARTIVDLAAIPEDVLPRFMEELPAILKAIRQIEASVDTLAAEARAKAPWFLRWAITPETIRSSILKSSPMVWVDDGKKTATVSMAVKHGDDPFYSRTEPLA